MKSLSVLEKESLEILKQLEHLCETVELIKPEEVSKEKSLSVKYNNIDFSILKRRKNIHAIEKYLRKNDVPFYLSDDFEFDDHLVLESSNDPAATYMEIGEVLGENVLEIKAKINSLIRKLDSEEEQKIVQNITYSLNIWKFIFNNEGVVLLEGKQRDVASCLVSNDAWESRVRIGDIYDYIKPLPESYNELRKNKKEWKTFCDVIREAANEINKKTKQYISEEKLIDYKNNEYWLERKIGKDG